MKGIMVQGTSSDAGKSFLVTALCRILSDSGLNVCPFKSQNMSNNSYVTYDGREIGRAQGAQAEAARTEPDVYMNPILLKPQTDNRSEIVVFGKVFDSLDGRDYYRNFVQNEGIEAVRKSLDYIRNHYEAVVIEGAGSPVEMNLNDREIVNMRVAREANVPVLLVTDIDRGGSMASVVGTLELLGENRKRVKGIIFNKFRGDISLFQDGIKFIENYTGVKVVGVIPYLNGIRIENEDNLSTDYACQSRVTEKIVIGVITMPFVSNNTDIEIFRYENDVEIRQVDGFTNFSLLDAVIIPGTKSTIEDLQYLKASGIGDKIRIFYRAGGHVFGLCGGYQILGEKIYDKMKIDNPVYPQVDGLSLLPVRTRFERPKTVKRVSGTVAHPAIPACSVSGYEIHLGVTERLERDGFLPLVDLGSRSDGAADLEFRVAGTYVHNIFHNDAFRNGWLNLLRRSKGYPERDAVDTESRKEADYAALAEAARGHLDIPYIMSLLDSGAEQTV